MIATSIDQFETEKNGDHETFAAIAHASLGLSDGFEAAAAPGADFSNQTVDSKNELAQWSRRLKHQLDQTMQRLAAKDILWWSSLQSQPGNKAIKVSTHHRSKTTPSEPCKHFISQTIAKSITKDLFVLKGSIVNSTAAASASIEANNVAASLRFPTDQVATVFLNIGWLREQCQALNRPLSLIIPGHDSTVKSAEEIVALIRPG